MDEIDFVKVIICLDEVGFKKVMNLDSERLRDH